MKTLLSGCSLSDWCGFGEVLTRDNAPPSALIGNHADPRCWYNIVKQNLNLDLTNVSYGGFSNEEILSAVLKKLALVDDYELVIIQVTATQRKWFYRADNPFAFCLAHGVNSQNETEKSMLDYFRVYFNNKLVEIERTLTTLILIQNYLKQKNIPLILVNGVNFGYYVKQLRTDSKAFCHRQISPHIWQFKGIPYAMELEALANRLDISRFVGLDQSFIELQIDQADDLIHPGTQSNLIYANLVAEEIQKIMH